MKCVELHTKEEILTSYNILLDVYPDLKYEDFENELDEMLSNNYFQIAIIDNDEIVGLTGVWINSKLWCGKYLELDNVVVKKTKRSQGIGKLLFEYAKEIAIKEKCTMLSLDSYTDNFNAHKFFYSEGYVPRGFHFINILDKSKVR